MWPEHRWIKECNSDELSSDPWHTKVHVIKSLTYRQAISWSGFFSYKHERNHIQRYKHFFMDYHEESYEIDRIQSELMKRHGIERTFEWIYHEDLYEFYGYIGYNRHTKKFERS